MTLPRAPLTIYLASRSEDRPQMRTLRTALAAQGIVCVSRWLDVEDITTGTPDQALMDLDDIRAADIFVLNKPRETHGRTTGGHHVETGYALAWGKPIVLIGEPENVFHQHPAVTVVPSGMSALDLGDVLFYIRRRVVRA